MPRKASIFFSENMWLDTKISWNISGDDGTLYCIVVLSTAMGSGGIYANLSLSNCVCLSYAIAVYVLPLYL